MFRNTAVLESKHHHFQKRESSLQAGVIPLLTFFQHILLDIFVTKPKRSFFGQCWDFANLVYNWAHAGRLKMGEHYGEERFACRDTMRLSGVIWQISADLGRRMLSFQTNFSFSVWGQNFGKTQMRTQACTNISIENNKRNLFLRVETWQW